MCIICGFDNKPRAKDCLMCGTSQSITTDYKAEKSAQKRAQKEKNIMRIRETISSNFIAGEMAAGGAHRKLSRTEATWNAIRDSAASVPHNIFGVESHRESDASSKLPGFVRTTLSLSQRQAAFNYRYLNLLTRLGSRIIFQC